MSRLSDFIARTIRQKGPIPFAEFMFWALYMPDFGYYDRDVKQIGRRGDFYTSVSVGPLFGELLAFQLARWAKPNEKFQIVESGAHDGKLAFDLLDALESEEPELWKRTEYLIIESLPRLRAAQQQALMRFSNVRWFESIEELRGQIRGVIFSNELLDAMPVHVFSWDAPAHRWNELGVRLDGDHFVFVPLAEPSIAPLQLPEALLNVLPDGYTIELSPAANQWWSDAASALVEGKLMTIDYGGVLEELLNPGRTHGTLRAYSQHHSSNDVLASPGEQDITAHVNFSEIRTAGERAGLKTETFTTQSQFLTTIAREMWQQRGSWPQSQVRQFQTLTHPEHLGRPFRVLLQSRGAR